MFLIWLKMQMKICFIRCEGLSIVYITCCPPVRVVDKLRESGHPFTLWCASGCAVECRICNREVAGSNLGLGYFAPRSTQPSIPPGSVNEYQLRLGRQGRYGSFRLRMNVWVYR